jgi:predicted GNAT family acetyltransferase
MIEHQPDKQRFILCKDDHECVLDYVVQGNHVDFTHTYVPFRLRGQGLAELLVEEGLKWAREQQLNIDASCWYVKKFL